MATDLFQRITDDLLVATGASRTTVRLSQPGSADPVLVAESLRPGVMSMRTTQPPGIAAAQTYVYLEQQRDLLVQRDTTEAPLPPRSLIENFGVGAQMLAPIVVDDSMVGTISVHQEGGPRDWSEADIGALRRARSDLEQAMAQTSRVQPPEPPADLRVPIQPTRDFIGYGQEGVRAFWPSDARVAVVLAVNYEEGSEYSFAAGDERNEAVGEFAAPINPPQSTVADLCTASTFEYGSRAGIWRLARILDAYGVRCTFQATSVALELNPAVAEYIVTGGHELCGHGWRWEELWRLSREEEAQHLAAAIASFQRTCGMRPRGWLSRCPPSPHTRELLLEEGGFIYDSDSYADDLPYFVEMRDRRHLIVPYSFTYNDMRFVFPGYADPGSFFNYCRMGLDLLWEEGKTHPKMMTIGLHARWTGQAARAAALRDFIEYALEKGGVWFTPRLAIAEWWIANCDAFHYGKGAEA